MKIALTGGTGFIGRNFLRFYRGSCNVLVRQKTEMQAPSNISEYIGNLNDSNFTSFLEDTDVLIHLACSMTPRSDFPNLAHEAEKNILGSIRLFEQFKNLNPHGKIIFFSSGGAIYNYQKNIPKQETDPVFSHTKYAEIKITLEKELSKLTKGSSLRSYSLRVSNPYGEVFSGTRKQGLIGIALQNAREGLPVTIFENKNTVRDYLHIHDLNQVLEKLISNQQTPPGVNSVYNIGTGVGTSLEELLAFIEEAIEKKIKVQYTNQDLEPTYNVLNIGKISEDFSWNSRISLLEGLKRSI